MTPQDRGQTPDETVVETKGKDQVMVPLRAEKLSVAKRRVATGQVKVGTVTTDEETMVVERRLVSKKVRTHEKHDTRSGWLSVSKKRSSPVSDLSPLSQWRGRTKVN